MDSQPNSTTTDTPVDETVSPSSTTEVSQPEQIKPSTNVLLSVLKSIGKAVVGIIVTAFKTLFNFFFQLSTKAKIAFIAILIVYGVIIALIFNNRGYNAGRLDVENMIRTETGMEIRELIQLSDKLKDLNITLDMILDAQ